AIPFNKKLRQGVLGRYGINSRLRQQKSKWESNPVAVIHCASMGEFEHIKPFIWELKNEKPELCLIVLFFSPSGYEQIKQFKAVDVFLYAPFDWIWPLWHFMKKVKPKIWIIAKHDVWPNQVWLARYFKIPLLLINASLHEQSRRLSFLNRWFQSSIYRQFNRILTISTADRRQFLKLVGRAKLEVAGDTKFDQVAFRRREALQNPLLPEQVTKGRWVLVAGSTWPEDQQHLIPAIHEIRKEFPNFLAVICPHEPTDQHLQEIALEMGQNETLLFSELENFRNHSAIIVDRMGILANLYSAGNAAYVGGSFRQNVHNVLEPAVYGIPVLLGPVNQNSHEAQLLKLAGGAFEVHQKEEIVNLLNKFLINDIYRQEAGMRARQVVKKNSGATLRTLKAVLELIR
ncbi:MAG: glycosyltransferase N-terminal domain-containing protein, partial [Calditrichia bacterium]